MAIIRVIDSVVYVLKGCDLDAVQLVYQCSLFTRAGYGGCAEKIESTAPACGWRVVIIRVIDSVVYVLEGCDLDAVQLVYQQLLRQLQNSPLP